MMLDYLPNLWPNQWRMSTWWPRDPRALMRRSLLRILAVAHEQRLEPAPLISNLAEEHRGANRRLLKRLARRIDGGLPLVAALEQTPDVLSDPQVLAIRFGSQSGTLQATYRRLIMVGETQVSTAGRDLWHAALYLVAMGIILLWITSFLFVFIYPTFDQMRHEFGVSEPPWTYTWVASGYHQFVALILLVPVVAILAMPLTWGSPLERWLRRWLANSRLRWVGQLRVAELLELLAQAVEAGRPLSSALSTLARYHFDKHVRARLLFVRNEVEQGAEVWDSLREAGFFSTGESHALTVSSSPAARAWLMRAVASQKRERVASLAETAAQWFQTMVIFIIAAAVLLLSCAGYQLLTQLIYELS